MKKQAFSKVLLLLIIVLVVTNGYSQKESAVWYFGDFAGLDFNSGDPVALNNSTLYTKEGCATISDPNGNLLFYTDGTTVWNRQHDVMPNGTGLLGHSSSTMSALIVPKPGSTSTYYIFTIDKPSYYLTEGQPIDGVNYSEVNMSLNNGFGDIVISNKNVHVVTYNTANAIESEYKSSEKITAVTHSNGGAVWVITHFGNKFYSFLVDENGVNNTPIISSTPLSVTPKINEAGANISAIGYLKVSPDGKKIAIAHSSISLGGPNSGRKKSGRILLYDFNNTTGEVSNQTNIISDVYPYGLEFSPNSKLLYATVSIFDTDDLFINSFLYQYNLESSNIVGSKQTISNNINVAGALQLAINGKIYRAGYQTLSVGTEISVINNPNVIGSGCIYNNNSIALLPNTASQLGLPPFVQSIFLASFDYEFTCLGDATHFYITSEDPYDSVLWDFGDGTTSTEIEPYHTYTQPGPYSVSLTFTVNSIDFDPYIKQIIISAPPEVLQTTYDLVQCDSFDNDPDDGVATYNLQLANQPITLNTTEAIQVFYYHNLTDAILDEHNANSVNNVYTNQYQDEILTAKVFKTNTECYSIATVRLRTSQSVNLNTFYLGGCDLDNDGSAIFDLEAKRNDIINTLNLPTNVSISFFENESQAEIGINALPNNYTSGNTTLYIRAESDNVCYGNGVLELELRSFPEVEDQIISTCATGFPITIDAGLDVALFGLFNYDWNGINGTNQLQVDQPGVYTITVSDPVLNCERTATITVYQNEVPQIQELLINDTTLTVALNNSSNDFLYSLENGLYQPENTFINLEPGLHTLYIKDTNECSIISRDFLIIGFPKFFTPNGDNNHDTWNIKGLDANRFPNTYIRVFDRYGKLITVFNPVESEGWNGKFNGFLLTPDDYWYYLYLPTGQQYRGHFSLKI